jgi:FkbM family methyltransferase
LLTGRYYAQHGEDARLRRTLKDVSNGRYVDIGAYEPEFNSVTKLFYDDGWKGTNVEPNPRAFKMLQEQRPHDVNLMAVATYKEEATLHLTDIRGWSSTRADVAAKANEYGMLTTEIDVKCMSLAAICEIMVGPIHFLKIDTEGTEDEVIASGDWKRHRPWVVVVEAVMPNTQKRVLNISWEPYLMSKGYDLRLDDGLNRWYTREDKSELKVTL